MESAQDFFGANSAVASLSHASVRERQSELSRSERRDQVQVTRVSVLESWPITHPVETAQVERNSHVALDKHILTQGSNLVQGQILNLWGRPGGSCPPVVKVKVMSTRRRKEQRRENFATLCRCTASNLNSTGCAPTGTSSTRSSPPSPASTASRSPHTSSPVSRNTVCKWLRHYQPGKPTSINQLSRRPNHCFHQTPAGLEGQSVKLRQQTAFGAERFKQEFNLPVSRNAIARILRQRGTARSRKRKSVTKKAAPLSQMPLVPLGPAREKMGVASDE